MSGRAQKTQMGALDVANTMNTGSESSRAITYQEKVDGGIVILYHVVSFSWVMVLGFLSFMAGGGNLPYNACQGVGYACSIFFCVWFAENNNVSGYTTVMWLGVLGCCMAAYGASFGTDAPPKYSLALMLAGNMLANLHLMAHFQNRFLALRIAPVGYRGFLIALMTSGAAMAGPLGGMWVGLLIKNFGKKGAVTAGYLSLAIASLGLGLVMRLIDYDRGEEGKVRRATMAARQVTKADNWTHAANLMRNPEYRAILATMPLTYCSFNILTDWIEWVGESLIGGDITPEALTPCFVAMSGTWLLTIVFAECDFRFGHRPVVGFGICLFIAGVLTTMFGPPTFQTLSIRCAFAGSGFAAVYIAGTLWLKDVPTPAEQYVAQGLHDAVLYSFAIFTYGVVLFVRVTFTVPEFAPYISYYQLGVYGLVLAYLFLGPRGKENANADAGDQHQMMLIEEDEYGEEEAAYDYE